MVTEKQRQKDKEKAVLFALQQGMALIRRDREIHGMNVDGTTVFLSRSKSYDEM